MQIKVITSSNSTSCIDRKLKDKITQLLHTLVVSVAVTLTLAVTPIEKTHKL